MTKTTRRRLFNVASLVLALVFLWLALWGVDLSKIGAAFREADYRWVPLLAALVVGSNLLRAWRWNVLIEALPPGKVSEDAGKKNTLEASFSSIMIGYMVNYAAPRLGEVARTANMTSRTRYRFSSLFGTVVSERIFDTLVLGVAILSAGGLLLDRLPVLRQRFFVPVAERLAALPMSWIVGGSAVLGVGCVGVAWWVWRGIQRERSALHQLWTQTLRPVLASFRDGLMTLLRSPKRAAILGSTVGMWAGYLMMAYVPFLMLGLAEPFGISLLDAWALMAIGALGLLVPSPGGLGSYHYITIQALVYLYAVPEAEAATYAVLTHAAQLVFYVLAGFVVLLYQGTGLRTLLPSRGDAPPEAAQEEVSSEPSSPPAPSPPRSPEPTADESAR